MEMSGGSGPWPVAGGDADDGERGRWGDGDSASEGIAVVVNGAEVDVEPDAEAEAADDDDNDDDVVIVEEITDAAALDAARAWTEPEHRDALSCSEESASAATGWWDEVHVGDEQCYATAGHGSGAHPCSKRAAWVELGEPVKTQPPQLGVALRTRRYACSAHARGAAGMHPLSKRSARHQRLYERHMGRVERRECRALALRVVRAGVECVSCGPKDRRTNVSPGHLRVFTDAGRDRAAMRPWGLGLAGLAPEALRVAPVDAYRTWRNPHTGQEHTLSLADARLVFMWFYSRVAYAHPQFAELRALSHSGVSLSLCHHDLPPDERHRLFVAARLADDVTDMPEEKDEAGSLYAAYDHARTAQAWNPHTGKNAGEGMHAAVLFLMLATRAQDSEALFNPYRAKLRRWGIIW
jgi:hypothetical protein